MFCSTPLKAAPFVKFVVDHIQFFGNQSDNAYQLIVIERGIATRFLVPGVGGSPIQMLLVFFKDTPIEKPGSPLNK